MTTSCGRILDAVSAILSVCHERTYEGEPAMKLESAARGGTDVLSLEPKISGNILNTTYLLQSLFQNLDRHCVKNLAYSAETYLAEGLATLALNQSEKTGIKTIGLSGGVAYNEHFTTSVRRRLRENRLRLLVHDEVPPGDAGIAFGQSIAVENWLNYSK